MARLLSTAKIAKIILAILIVIALVFFIYWLWQRQPKAPHKQEATFTQSQDKSGQDQIGPTISFSPKDSTIVSDNKIKFVGKVNPNEFVLLNSNSSQKITKANASGDFQIDAQIDPGINLINITTLNENLAQNQSASISLYQKVKDDPKEINTFYAGSVKNIFDNIITLATATGEKTLRQKSSTKIILPKEAKSKEDQNIRVGDYLIALGILENEKDFNTISIEIIRVDKPQNKIQFASSKFLTSVKQNLFSANDVKDNKIIEFALDKKSQILTGDNLASTKDIVKDKKAIVFYQNQDNQNLVKTIYLLP